MKSEYTFVLLHLYVCGGLAACTLFSLVLVTLYA